MQILGVRELTHLDVIERYIMPAFKADSACGSPADQLVAMLAFIGHSQLLQRTVADGPVSTPEGIRLLEQLQRHAVICTEQGPMRFADAPALHMPMSLGCKVLSFFDLQCMCMPAHGLTPVECSAVISTLSLRWANYVHISNCKQSVSCHSPLMVPATQP